MPVPAGVNYFGATDTVEAGDTTRADVMELTGVDVSIEAVGYPETLLTAASVVRRGGTIAKIGVHGARLHALQGMWSQDVTLIVGLVDTVSMPALLKMVAGGCIPAEKTGTHWFTFARMGEACDVLSNAAGSSALKVVITPS
jgi:alcohol dehydrogenase